MRIILLLLVSTIVNAAEPMLTGLGDTDSYVRTLYQKTGSGTWIPQDDQWEENSEILVDDLRSCVANVQEGDRVWPKIHELVSVCMHAKGYKLYTYVYE